MSISTIARPLGTWTVSCRGAIPLIGLLLLGACHRDGDHPRPSPSIQAFTAEPAVIEFGEEVHLRASFSHGTGKVDPEPGAVASGVERVVSPRSTTTYTLKVTGPGGPPATMTAVVTVKPALHVTIQGLEGGLDGGGGGVTVTGPDGFHRTLDETTLLKGLTPGHYTVKATPVPGGKGTLHPLKPEQTFHVTTGTEATVGFAAPALSINLPGGVPMEFVEIPAGSNTLGTGEGYTRYMISTVRPTPPHRVEIDKPFFMTRFLVSPAQWNAVVEPAERRGDDSFPGPVRSVSFVDIRDHFLPRLNRLHPGFTFRLPTEAEWEYACRAGTTTHFFFGNNPGQVEEVLSKYAWRTGDLLRHPSGAKWANPWGLHDLSGLGLQWCEDTAIEGYEGAPGDGSARVQPGNGSRIQRGSTTYGIPGLSAWRGSGKEVDRYPAYVLRLVATRN